MNRLTSWAYAPAISTALATIPERLHARIACDFLTGTDPIWVGLHRYEAASFGRSYAETAHCVYPFHQTPLVKSSRRTTVVLPAPVTPRTVIHELGHVLHESLRFEPTTTAVSWYGATNRFEAFAEAFTSWLVPGHAARPDDAFLALMDSL